MLHHINVDDNVYLNIADHACFKHATAAGIEAIVILLGESDLMWHQDPISWDKLLDMNIAPINCILILTIDIRHLT